MLRRPFFTLPLASGLIAGVGGWPTATAQALGITARTLQFPADFGAHPDTRIEWWYLTGWLAAAGNAGSVPSFGFQLTFFRLRTGVAADHPSRFAARQLVLAHVALSQVATRQFRHDQRSARSGFDIAEARTDDTQVWLRDWRLQRDGPAEASRYHAQVDSTAAGFGLDLQLAATQAVLLQGQAGLSQKGPDPAQVSHYYSQPQLLVNGQLKLDGRSLPVRGKAWLDHEWSNSLLAADAVGWDWIGINLDKGGALTAFRLRRANGSAVFAGGSWRPLDGPLRNFAATEVSFEAQRRWRSAQTQAEYPVAWRVTTPIGTFGIEALFDDQELDSRRSTGAVYWEGLSRLTDSAGQMLGHGYLEMTGYAARLEI